MDYISLVRNNPVFCNKANQRETSSPGFMLCETFLKDGTDNHFNIPGYNLVTKNRPGTSRGGVAIYVNKKFNFKIRDDLGINFPGTFESIFIEIQYNKLKAIVGEIYRVPNTNELISIKRYEQILKKLQHYRNNIIIGTDQNFDYIKIDQHKNIEDLLSIFLTNGLVPTITKPTRITHTTATLIDNIYISLKIKITLNLLFCALTYRTTYLLFPVLEAKNVIIKRNKYLSKKDY
jgi:hypothetical protein